MQRTPVIVGNWKMNLSLEQAISLAQEIAYHVPQGVEAGVAPPTAYLFAIAQKVQGSQLGIGAQHMYYQAKGAFTGENSPAHLADIGCRYIIIGHSERRQLFHETDQEVSNKARAAHDHDLTPILCVGETLSEREAGQTLSRVLSQVDAAFSELSANEAVASICAYEPVWAIGTGKTATPEQAQEVHYAIRERLAQRFGSEVASQIRLQYGGSVKPENAKSLMSQADIDGALVGGASLTASSFINILSQTVS